MIREQFEPSGVCHIFGIDDAIIFAAVAVATAAATAYSGYSAYQTQQANAKIADQFAEQQRQAAALDAQKQKEESERQLARARGTYIKAGLDTSVGSPVDVLAESAANAAFDNALIRWGGERGANQAEGQAAMARWSGNQSLVGGIVGAGTSLLTAGSKYYARQPNTPGNGRSILVAP